MDKDKYKQMIEALKPIMDAYFKEKTTTKGGHEKFKADFEHYIRKNGLIFPTSFDDFWMWFIGLPENQQKTPGIDPIELEPNHFIRYHNYMESQLLKTDDANDWGVLYNNLINIYIKDANLSDFSEVMNYKRLPNSKNKILWIREKTEAMYFGRHYNFATKQLNECFNHINGGVFHGNNLPINYAPKADFKKLLQ